MEARPARRSPTGAAQPAPAPSLALALALVPMLAPRLGPGAGPGSGPGVGPRPGPGPGAGAGRPPWCWSWFWSRCWPPPWGWPRSRCWPPALVLAHRLWCWPRSRCWPWSGAGAGCRDGTGTLHLCRPVTGSWPGRPAGCGIRGGCAVGGQGCVRGSSRVGAERGEPGSGVRLVPSLLCDRACRGRADGRGRARPARMGADGRGRLWWAVGGPDAGAERGVVREGGPWVVGGPCVCVWGARELVSGYVGALGVAGEVMRERCPGWCGWWTCSGSRGRRLLLPGARGGLAVHGRGRQSSWWASRPAGRGASVCGGCAVRGRACPGRWMPSQRICVRLWSR